MFYCNWTFDLTFVKALSPKFATPALSYFFHPCPASTHDWWNFLSSSQLWSMHLNFYLTHHYGTIWPWLTLLNQRLFSRPSRNERQCLHQHEQQLSSQSNTMQELQAEQGSFLTSWKDDGGSFESPPASWQEGCFAFIPICFVPYICSFTIAFAQCGLNANGSFGQKHVSWPFHICTNLAFL